MRNLIILILIVAFFFYGKVIRGWFDDHSSKDKKKCKNFKETVKKTYFDKPKKKKTESKDILDTINNQL